MPAAALDKILIIRFSSLGDILLASPLVRLLRRAYPHAQIDFLLKSKFADLMRYNPDLSSLIELSTSDGKELNELRRRIQTVRYDAIFDLHNSLRSRYVRTFAGAKHVRVVDKKLFPRFMLLNLKKNFYGKNVPGVAQRYIETAHSFGIEDDQEGLNIVVPRDIASETSVLLSKYHLDRHEHVIGIVAGARHFTKRWPQERFVALGCMMAKEYKAKLLLFGGKEEEEYCGDIAQMINASCGASAAENLAGSLSLLENAAAFDACNLVVTNDTGLMHVAAARKRKIVAIFGSTVREFGFFPSYTENIVVERNGLDCRPCTHIGLAKCPEGHFRCMKEIDGHDVARVVRQLMNIPVH